MNLNWRCSISELFVRSYLGLGDNIYIRPIVVDLCNKWDTIYLETPWPQLFWDMDNIEFVKPKTKLRTQKKNMDICEDWVDTPINLEVMRPRYGAKTLRAGKNPYKAFESYSCPDKFDFTLPTDPWDKKARLMSSRWGAFAIVRPVTCREEWEAPARNCDPYYIEQLCAYLQNEGITIVEVADLSGIEEYREGLLDSNYKFVQGELDPMLIAALMKLATVTVAPVGFALPMGIAVNAPIFTVFGGYMAPHLLTDARMDLSKYGYAAPDPFCSCLNRKHQSCQKHIQKLTSTFSKYLARLKEPNQSYRGARSIV